jgi:hypothetical protein
MIKRSFILIFLHSIFSQCVSISFQCALTSNIERKIALAGDACSKPHITIKSYDLHATNIKRAMGEIISYHERDYLFPFFWFLHIVHPLAFFGLPFWFAL